MLEGLVLLLGAGKNQKEPNYDGQKERTESISSRQGARRGGRSINTK